MTLSPNLQQRLLRLHHGRNLARRAALALGLALAVSASPARAGDEVEPVEPIPQDGQLVLCGVSALTVVIRGDDVILEADSTRWLLLDGAVLLGMDVEIATHVTFDIEGAGLFVTVDGVDQPTLAAAAGLASYPITLGGDVFEFEVDDNVGSIRVPTLPDVVFEPVPECPAPTE